MVSKVFSILSRVVKVDKLWPRIQSLKQGGEYRDGPWARSDWPLGESGDFPNGRSNDRGMTQKNK